MGAIAGRHISITAPMAPTEARTTALIHNGLALMKLPFMKMPGAADARSQVMMSWGS